MHALEHWALAKADRAKNPPMGFVGGHGYPDPEIYDWVDRLNELANLCTVQSCAGHICLPGLHCAWCRENTDIDMYSEQEWRDDDSVVRHVRTGQLWLWLNQDMATWFYRNAMQLVLLPGIEKVAIIWVDVHEYVDIQFRGAGHGELDQNMAAILRFFQNGNRLVNLSD